MIHISVGDREEKFLFYFWKVHILEQPEAWFKDMGGCVKRCILVVEIKRRCVQDCRGGH